MIKRDSPFVGLEVFMDCSWLVGACVCACVELEKRTPDSRSLGHVLEMGKAGCFSCPGKRTPNSRSFGHLHEVKKGCMCFVFWQEDARPADFRPLQKGLFLDCFFFHTRIQAQARCVFKSSHEDQREYSIQIIRLGFRSRCFRTRLVMKCPTETHPTWTVCLMCRTRICQGSQHCL